MISTGAGRPPPSPAAGHGWIYPAESKRLYPRIAQALPLVKRFWEIFLLKTVIFRQKNFSLARKNRLRRPFFWYKFPKISRRGHKMLWPNAPHPPAAQPLAPIDYRSKNESNPYRFPCPQAKKGLMHDRLHEPLCPAQRWMRQMYFILHKLIVSCPFPLPFRKESMEHMQKSPASF